MSIHLCNVDQFHQPGLEGENILPLYISAMRQVKQNNIKWLAFDSAPIVELLITENNFFQTSKSQLTKKGEILKEWLLSGLTQKASITIFFFQLTRSCNIIPLQISEILIEFLTFRDASNVGVCDTDIGEPLHPLKSSIFNA